MRQVIVACDVRFLAPSFFSVSDAGKIVYVEVEQGIRDSVSMSIMLGRHSHE